MVSGIKAMKFSEEAVRLVWVRKEFCRNEPRSAYAEHIYWERMTNQNAEIFFLQYPRLAIRIAHQPKNMCGSSNCAWQEAGAGRLEPLREAYWLRGHGFRSRPHHPGRISTKVIDCRQSTRLTVKLPHGGYLWEMVNRNTLTRQRVACPSPLARRLLFGWRRRGLDFQTAHTTQS